MKYFIVILIIILTAYLVTFTWYTCREEGFTQQKWEHQLSDEYVSLYQNAHGSRPVGLSEIGGSIQHEQNASAIHVNKVYQSGNPQNVAAAFKRQP